MTDLPSIPIVRVNRDGKESLVGIASDMARAESLLSTLVELYRGRGATFYIDCARTPEEVRAGSV